jgi:myosin heavy subunit
LIEQSPNGIITLLDEECVVPKGSDLGFVSKLREKFSRHPSFVLPRTSQTCFGIAHYAGQVRSLTGGGGRQRGLFFRLPLERNFNSFFPVQVVYEGENFLVKNKDALQPSIVDLMTRSGSAFVRMLFSQVRVQGGNGRKGHKDRAWLGKGIRETRETSGARLFFFSLSCSFSLHLLSFSLFSLS